MLECKDCCLYDTDACRYGKYALEHNMSLNCDDFIVEHNKAYQQGRSDKYQEIVSECMLLTEKQVEDIRADERVKVLETINKYKVATNSEHVFIVDEHYINSLEEQIRADERAKINKHIDELREIYFFMAKYFSEVNISDEKTELEKLALKISTDGMQVLGSIIDEYSNK